MLYLLDAGVLITASNSYYRLDSVPEFWAWLRFIGNRGDAKIPHEQYDEIRAGRDDDPLCAWIKEEETKAALLLNEEADPVHVNRVVGEGYANDLTDDELEQVGTDPFLIAYALAHPADRCVVTTEVSSPRKQRQNRKIPDVCDGLGVRWSDPFRFYGALNFRTGWRE